MALGFRELGCLRNPANFFYSTDRENNFDKFAQGKILHLGEPYDYGSIMHYGTHAFSSNAKPTIITLQTGGAQIGQREALSANDIRQINKLYKCPTGRSFLSQGFLRASTRRGGLEMSTEGDFHFHMGKRITLSITRQSKK